MSFQMQRCCIALHLSSNTWDHLPLLLIKETTEVVRAAWQKHHLDDPGRNLFMCIQNSRLGLLQWKREVLGHVQNKIKSKQASLDKPSQGTITNNSKGQTLQLIKEIDKLREAHDAY
ncbi:hypothetical protein LIER_38319 [Lithospermum erythrorhizon]|uniref:Uncharacterized protein n=1 Tax=Lithospermum erythrorhizon TaxID=34254 RepID=A0AAV3PZI0_LITER